MTLRPALLTVLILYFSSLYISYAGLLTSVLSIALSKSARFGNVRSSSHSITTRNSSGNSTIPKMHSLSKQTRSKIVLSYLRKTYKVKTRPKGPKEFYIRQVPGDGACLFNALASSIVYKISREHFVFEKNMEMISAHLRELAVKVLSSENTSFHMEKGEYVNSSELLAMTAEHYKTTAEKYCREMLKRTTWGGGPEIVALCNYMKRPIHVYELCIGSNKGEKKFKLKICARFGSPAYKKKSPLYILCADGRFPNVKPGQQKPLGDHFLALFPKHAIDAKSKNSYDCFDLDDNFVDVDKVLRFIEGKVKE